MIQICAALSATHGQGLIHRDLKPGNVMLLKNGRVKILDFGLVKPIDGAAHEALPTLTSDSVVMGTPWYMAPEHVRGEVLDARADVYALGIILYEMLTGKTPFDGVSVLEIIDKQLNAPVPLPGTLEPPIHLPHEVEWVLLKALHKDRAGRYQSTAELADAIYQIADDQGFRIFDLLPSSGSKPRDSVPPRRQTLKWGATPPQVDQVEPIEDIHDMALARRGEIIDRVFGALVEAFPRYRDLDQRGLQARIAWAVDAATLFLGAKPGETPTLEKGQAVVVVPDEEMTLTELITALWLAYTVWRPLIVEVSTGDVERFARLANQFDKRVLPFFFHAVDTYVSTFQGRLQRANESLARQNDELQQLRSTLSEQVEETSRQMIEAERLKARVAESVPSGIALIEQATGRVLLWNAALERLSGLSASQVVGVPISKVASMVEGLPFHEFAEQLRYHGEVGLRKLRIKPKGREQRVIYLKGQPFRSASGEHIGTLFVVDDVTEREQIIESLGRYLSKDLVDRIVSRASSPEPEVKKRRAVILSVQIDHRPESLEKLSSEGLVQLFNQYVRAVSRTVFQRGGSIERIAADGLLAYFARYGDSPDPAIHAALELSGLLTQVCQSLVEHGGEGFDWRLGLHVGDILVLNVGSSRHMVQTVIGESTRTAEALCYAASPGEILVSSDLEGAASRGFSFAEGPRASVPGRLESIPSFRVSASVAPELENEPITMTTRRPE
jgi:PAS domain S-box-containing protein